MTDIFPFTIHCDREHGHMRSDLMSLFLSVKPRGMTWYGADTIFLSPTEIEFVVYNMADVVHGGVGYETARIRHQCPTPIATQYITDRCIRVAKDQRAVELELREAAIIAQYADSLLSNIGIVDGADVPL